MSGEPDHVHATYNDIHNMIKASAQKIQAEFKPDIFIAIGKSSRVISGEDTQSDSIWTT